MTTSSHINRMRRNPNNPFSSARDRSATKHLTRFVCLTLGALISPWTLGILLTSFGVYLHVFYYPSLPSTRWITSSEQHVVRTRPKPLRSAPKELVAMKPESDKPAHPLLKEKPDERLKSLRRNDAKELVVNTANQRKSEVDEPVHPVFREMPDDLPTRRIAVQELTVNTANPRKQEADTPVHPLLKETPDEQVSRHLRFPSVSERVKVYMGDWYNPPCPDNDNAVVKYRYTSDTNTAGGLIVQELPAKENDVVSAEYPRYFYNLTNFIEMARVFQMDRESILTCTSNEYCVDSIEYWVPAIDRLRAQGRLPNPPVPTLAHFGDSNTPKAKGVDGAIRDFPRLPYIMKFRFRFKSATAIADMTTASCVEGYRPIHETHGLQNLQPVVWRLTSLRHYGMMDRIIEGDIAWHMKKDAAIWRGALTGVYRDGFKTGMLKSKSPGEICNMMHRCRLALQSASTTLVDAKLVGPEKWIPRMIDGIEVYGDKLDYEQMLQYKAIIMLEGNDISSGFKWALYSNSVVLTEIPTKTSWAMEELLLPWVHFVPLKSDLSDVQEKMQWVLDNQEEAQKIAQQGSLWVQDLLYHPDSASDDEKIYDEMLQRLWKHFKIDPMLLNDGGEIE